MQQSFIFFTSFIIVGLLHIYLLSTTKVITPAITINTKNISPTISLREAVIKPPPAIKEPFKPKLPKIPLPIVKQSPQKIAVAKKEPQKVVKKIKKRPTPRKKAKKVAKKVIKTGATKSASPKQKQIKNTYISHVKRLIHQKKRYPRLAKRMGHEGTVKIAFTIQANGSIVEARVLSGSGHQRLDKAALKILKSIGRFPPIPKEVGDSTLSITLPIRYKLIT